MIIVSKSAKRTAQRVMNDLCMDIRELKNYVCLCKTVIDLSKKTPWMVCIIWQWHAISSDL